MSIMRQWQKTMRFSTRSKIFKKKYHFIKSDVLSNQLNILSRGQPEKCIFTRDFSMDSLISITFPGLQISLKIHDIGNPGNKWYKSKTVFKYVIKIALFCFVLIGIY